MAALEYAKRGLVGVLTPQANTTVEPEFAILWPPGMAMLSARLTSSKDTMEGRLEDYSQRIGATLDHFANAPIQAAAFACTGACYLMGREKEAEICDRIEQSRGYPLVTAGRAVTESLTALGAKTIGLVSPYPDALTKASVAYWQSAGFAVGQIATASENDGDFHPIYGLRAENGAKALRSLEDGKLDAIVMLGTGMPTLRPVLDAADWNGPPVTSSMISLAWRTVLQMDGTEPSALNMLAWCRGEGWGTRMAANGY